MDYEFENDAAFVNDVKAAIDEIAHLMQAGAEHNIKIDFNISKNSEGKFVTDMLSIVKSL